MSFDLYNGGNGGTKVAVTTGSGSPNFSDSTGSLNMGSSANPTNVVISYDGSSSLTVTMIQGSYTFTKSYTVNIPFSTATLISVSREVRAGPKPPPP